MLSRGSATAVGKELWSLLIKPWPGVSHARRKNPPFASLECVYQKGGDRSQPLLYGVSAIGRLRSP